MFVPLSRPRVGLVLAGLLLAGCGAQGPPASPSRTGDRQGNVRFARPLEGPVVPGPVVQRDGTVLAASNGGVLHALDPRSGRDRWTFDGGGSYGIDLSTSPLVLADDLILWPGPGDQLFALDDRGRERWRTKLDGFVLTPVRGRGSTVYVQDMSGRLHALDVTRERVRRRWTLTVGPGVSYGSPAASPDLATIYTTVGSELVAVHDDGDAGTVRWRFAARADVEVSPAVAPDGTIVLGTNDRWQYGVTPAGRERWRWERGVWTYSSPLTTPDGLVHFGDHRGRLVTLDTADGRVVQTLTGRNQVWTRPVLDAQGDVFFGAHGGEVFGFDPQGRRILHVTTGASVESYPAVGRDGTVYIGSEDGRLYAVKP